MKRIRDDVESVRQGVQAKKVDVDLDALLEIDEKKRSLAIELDTLRAQKNAANLEISAALQNKKDPKEKSILIEFRNISVRLPNYDIINIMEKKLLDELFNKKLNRELSKFVFKFIHALLYFLYQNLENPTKLINALQIESDKDIKNYP